MVHEKEMLRPADVAPLLGVTSGRVYQLIAAGVIPAVRVGGALRIPRDAWQAWLKGRTTEALRSLRDPGRAAGETGAALQED